MRSLYFILLALVLALPFALREAAMRREAPPVKVGPGAARLVIVTPHTGDIRREFSRAFDEWHRDRYGQSVLIDFRVPGAGGTADMVRLLASTYAAYRGREEKVELDVVWGGGDYTFYHDLAPLGILQPIPIGAKLLREAFPEDSLAGVRLYDATKAPDGRPTPQWIGICLSAFGIVYNSQLYQALQLPPPNAWPDLTDPKLSGLVALADPSHSGSAGVTYMMVIQRAMADAEQALLARDPLLQKLPRAELRQRAQYQQAIADGWHRGMGQLLLIAANARYFADSSTLVPTDVGRGEAAAGMSIDFYARVTEGTVGSDRARFVLPRASTAITPDPVAILRGVSGPRLVVATHFVEFLLTPQSQRLWILKPGEPGGPIERSPRRMPVRRDVYANQSGWADHFDPFDMAGGFNQRGEWMALMSDTAPIWVAAWIDSRPSLLNAYHAILSVKDDALRARLLAELADVPVTMHDIEQRRAERLRLVQSHADLDEWNARQRIRWATRFRDHYQRVAAQARP